MQPSSHPSNRYTVRVIYFQPIDAPSPEEFDKTLESSPTEEPVETLESAPSKVEAVVQNPIEESAVNSPVSSIETSPFMLRTNEMMEEVQKFYGRQMERHGYGNKTFTFAPNPEGTGIVHYIKGEHKKHHYSETTTKSVKAELCQQNPSFFKPNNIYVMIVGGLDHVNNYGCRIKDVYGIAHTNMHDKYGGIATIAGNCPSLSLVVKHEVGHTFGLRHNKNPGAIMYKSIIDYEHERVLSKEEARWLDKHHYFNRNPTVQSRPEIADCIQLEDIGEGWSRLQIDVKSENELYQAQIINPSKKEVICWDYLNGRTFAQFDVENTEFNIGNNCELHVRVMDIHGNYNEVISSKT